MGIVGTFKCQTFLCNLIYRNLGRGLIINMKIDLQKLSWDKTLSFDESKWKCGVYFMDVSMSQFNLIELNSI